MITPITTIKANDPALRQVSGGLTPIVCGPLISHSPIAVDPTPDPWIPAIGTGGLILPVLSGRVG